jgi:hypothetical protein
MVFQENTQEGEHAVDKKISKVVEKTIEKMPLPEEKKAEMIKRAGEMEIEMKKKYTDLTGANNEYEQEGLYRHMLREMMARVRWLSPETLEELGKIYKKDGRVRGLSEIKEKHFTGESKSNKISKEAEEFEKIALMFMEHVEDGWVGPRFFLGQLFKHLENEALRKQREKIGNTIQTSLEEGRGNELAEVEKGVKKEKERYATFSEMVKNKRSRYVAEKARMGEKIIGGEIGERDTRAMFDRFRNDPKISADFDFWLDNSLEAHDDVGRLAELDAGKTIRQAQLSGLQLPGHF